MELHVNVVVPRNIRLFLPLATWGHRCVIGRHADNCGQACYRCSAVPIALHRTASAASARVLHNTKSQDLLHEVTPDVSFPLQSNIPGNNMSRFGRMLMIRHFRKPPGRYKPWENRGQRSLKHFKQTQSLWKSTLKRLEHFSAELNLRTARSQIL